MTYDEMYQNLLMLKENSTNYRDKDRIKELLTILSKHPDGADIIKDMFIDERYLKKLHEYNLSNKKILENVKNFFEIRAIRTSNSLELTYKYFGYVKTITPKMLDDFIDQVVTRVQREKEYANIINLEPEIERQEDLTTVNELSQFC